MAALGLVAGLCLSGSAYALFPPPFYFPPVTNNGNPDPELPPPPPPPVIDLPPPPTEPEPCGCPCPPVHTHATPEPTTIVSGLVGMTMLGGYVLRRKRQK
jgi:PEP-CTERM motif-containing protein